MPTYDYKCEACGHTFEKFQRITAAPIRKCPQCGKNKVKRLLGTGGGLIFKGSGFYITDYRSEGYKSAAKADSGTSGTGGGSDNGKASGTPSTSSTPSSTESKPAAKTDSKSSSSSTSSSTSSSSSSNKK
jgi:putative FmdB family regulatory protein